jgi:hypothetical protein
LNFRSIAVKDVLVVEQTHLSQKQRGTAELLGQLNMGQWPRHRSINRTVGPAAE